MTSGNMVRIDGDKVKRWLYDNRLSAVEVSQKIGTGRSFISGCIHKKKMHKQTLTLLCALYGLPKDAFLPDPEPVRAEPAPPTAPQTGYSMALEVKPDKVRVAVLFDGKETYSAYYKVADNTEVSLMRAISCATHICYELAQQAELKGE